MFKIKAHIKSSLLNSFLYTDSPALNHFDCILFVSNDAEFRQKLKQVVALHHKVPLKQSHDDAQSDGWNLYVKLLSENLMTTISANILCCKEFFFKINIQWSKAAVTLKKDTNTSPGPRMIRFNILIVRLVNWLLSILCSAKLE